MEAELSPLAAPIVPFSFFAFMLALASFEASVSLYRGCDWRTFEREPVRDRGGLGGGVPMLASALNEFILWTQPCACWSTRCGYMWWTRTLAMGFTCRYLLPTKLTCSELVWLTGRQLNTVLMPRDSRVYHKPTWQCCGFDSVSWGSMLRKGSGSGWGCMGKA